MLGTIRKKLHKFIAVKKKKKLIEENNKLRLSVQNTVCKCGCDLEVFGEPEILFPEKLHIGDGCKINRLVYLNARSGIILGNYVTLSRGAKLISTGYDIDMFFDKGERVHITDKPIYIGDHCWICADAMILPGVEITGEYVIVAAGAIVTKSINESRVIVAGNPARIIKRMG